MAKICIAIMAAMMSFSCGSKPPPPPAAAVAAPPMASPLPNPCDNRVIDPTVNPCAGKSETAPNGDGSAKP